jgi:hypothetical protein
VTIESSVHSSTSEDVPLSTSQQSRHLGATGGNSSLQGSLEDRGAAPGMVTRGPQVTGPAALQGPVPEHEETQQQIAAVTNVAEQV